MFNLSGEAEDRSVSTRKAMGKTLKKLHFISSNKPTSVISVFFKMKRAKEKFKTQHMRLLFTRKLMFLQIRYL